MRLKDVTIRQTAPSSRPIRLTDGRGLYLLIQPTGAKWWRFDYRFKGTRKTISLGVYPDVGLAAARDACQAARTQVAAGIDPSAARQLARRQEEQHAAAQAATFGALAAEYLDKQRGVLAPATYAKSQWMLETLVGPWLGHRPIGEIEPPEVLGVLRRLEARGKIETAHRTREKIGQVFRYAIATGRAKRDPTPDLKGALPPAKPTHRAAITDPIKFGELLRVIDDCSASFVVATALRLLPLVFVRPGELRHAEWGEFDLEAAEWRIPGHRMKMREQHLVPLSTQAVALLRDLYPYSGPHGYVFPSMRSRRVPMSENTLNATLRRLGYGPDTMTAHGFRAVASTFLYEMGWRSEVIERQLAHAERNKVKAAYNRAQHLAERREMMQAWADYLGRLRTLRRVVEIRPGVVAAGG